MRTQPSRLLWTIAGCVVLTRSAAGQETPLRAEVEQRLLESCDVQPVSIDRSATRILTSDAVVYIAEAFEQGPSQTFAEEVRAASLRRFDAIMRLVESGATFGLSNEEVNRLRQTTPEEYAASAVSDFRFSYRDAALRLAATISGNASQAFLRTVSVGQDSTFASTAATLLRNRDP